MMADYSDLLPDILPHVASCPLPTVMRAIKVIAQDYFQRSEAYIHTIAPTVVNANTPDVNVVLPSNTRLVVPLTMYIDGERLATTNEEMLSLNYGDWRSTTGNPVSVMTADSSPTGLIVAPPSTSSHTLTGRVAIKPTRSAEELDDDQMELHGDALVDGVLHRLLMMKNSEWYDAALAGYHEVQYERAIDEAHGVSNKGNTSRVMTTGYGG